MQPHQTISGYPGGRAAKHRFTTRTKGQAQLFVAKRPHDFTADPAADVAKQHLSRQVVHF